MQGTGPTRQQVLEGSVAIAQAVAACRPQVIAAYPITPQTHIVEALAQLVAEGALKAEFVNVESEFSAASVVLGATAAGARAYTATSSQGLLLMAEVLHNIAGLRLPVVMTVANRAISAPLNIWNDHSDAMAVRDAGWVQLWAEDNQEAVDLHVQAYRLAEVLCVPVMVNVDGFVLTHAFEPVVVPAPEEVDAFLPRLGAVHRLDPARPVTLGMMAEPSVYMEARHQLHAALGQALEEIPLVGRDWLRASGRRGACLVERYQMQQAEVAVVSMGSVLGTIKEAVDTLQAEGLPVGVVKLGTFRPFPAEPLRRHLRGVERVLVIEKAQAPGTPQGGGILVAEVRGALYGIWHPPRVDGYVGGLGGRDITVAQVRDAIRQTWLAPPADREQVSLATTYAWGAGYLGWQGQVDANAGEGGAAVWGLTDQGPADGSPAAGGPRRAAGPRPNGVTEHTPSTPQMTREAHQS